MALMKAAGDTLSHHRLAELIEAFDLHAQAARKAEEAGRQTEAILLYRALIDMRDELWDEAWRLGLPLACTGLFADDLEVMRSFVAGSGWQ
jgi:hypothetical protein